jgi:hypothetical protein
MKILNLGTTSNNKTVLLDYGKTNVGYHLLETPDLIELVREALPNLVVGSGDQLVFEWDLGRIVGTTNLVETTDTDEIVYAKRVGRYAHSRFVKNRQPVACSSIVIVLRNDGADYYLWTAMCARLLPKEAWIEDSLFNKTHAMAYDETLIQLNTLTESKPVFSQKYTIVQFFGDVEDGYEYSSDNWPLHSTIIDTFAINWSVDEVAVRLTEAMRGCVPACSEAGDDTYFGEEGKVQVVLLDRTDSLMKLHLDVLNSLQQGGLVLNDPQFAYDRFLPHATVQKNARLTKGDKVQFTDLSIVDMFPGSDPYTRRILRTIRVGN